MPWGRCGRVVMAGGGCGGALGAASAVGSVQGEHRLKRGVAWLWRRGTHKSGRRAKPFTAFEKRLLTQDRAGDHQMACVYYDYSLMLAN